MPWQLRPGEQVRALADRFRNSCPRPPAQPSLTLTRRKTAPESLQDLVIKDAKDKTLSSNHWFHGFNLLHPELPPAQRETIYHLLVAKSFLQAHITETPSLLLAGPCLVLNVLFIAQLFFCSFYQMQLLQSSGAKTFH